MQGKFSLRAALLFVCIYVGLGLFLQAQLAGHWKAIGPLSSPVREMATDGAVLFANSYAGIYQSLDQGETWQVVQRNSPQELYRNEFLSSRVLQIESTLSGVYALAHEYGDASLVRLTDQYPWPWRTVAGWDSVRNYLLDSWDRPVTFIAAGSRLLAGKLGHPDLVRSDDGGASWTLQPDALPGGVHLFWEWEAQNHILHFGKAGQASVSYDQGLNWHPYPVGNLPAAPAALAAKGSRLFAAVPGYGIYRSVSGASWVRVQDQLPFTDITGLAISNDRLYAASARQGVWQSTDHGATWQPAGLEDELLSGLYTLDGSLFACGADGVYRKAPGANTWTQFVEGLGNVRVTRIVTGANGLFVAGFEEGSFDDEEESGTVYASAHPNRRWAQIEGGRLSYGYTVKQLYPQQDTLTAVFRTNASNDLYEGILVLQFSLLNNRPVLMMLDSAGAYEGEEMDQVLSAAYAGEVYFVSGGLKNLYRSPAVAPVFPGPVNRIYARGQVLIAATPNGIFYSFDQAQTWPTQQLAGQHVLSLIERGASMYAETTQGYWKYTVAGWTMLTNFTPGIWNKGILYRINAGVAEYSNTQGNSWTALPGTPPVTALAVSDDYLFAGTNGSGVWRRTEVSGNVAKEASTFSLLPAEDISRLTAFPNPTGQYLAVEYPASGQLELWSLEGKQLLSQPFTGSQQILDVTALPAGIYLLRLRTDTDVQTLRVVRQ
ncbi:MAG: T9SS type A sorting domain-containing protein [Bacteroidia bacterium]|nr:T9SS type A sorting domain-containing protein [Bacteroidia bacterium]